MKPGQNLLRMPCRLPRAAGLLLGLTLLAAPAARAGDAEVVAVSSHVSDGYVRAKLANGSFQPETYAFGEGGRWAGKMRDDTIDQLHFIDVARTIARPLAGQGYLPTKDPNQTRLLIMVYWGTTAGTDDTMSGVAFQNLEEANRPLPQTNVTVGAGATPAGRPQPPRMGEEQRQASMQNMLLMISMINHQRDRTDWKNAAILGYDEELKRSQGLELTPLAQHQRDLVEEIEENRYFVVLMAYDFQLMWKEKKTKVLWITRFSIREHGSHFGQDLAAMADSASKYFGQESHGLLRKPLSEGRVTLGDLKVIEVVPEK